MSIKIHFLHSHPNRFADNCGEYSDKQGDNFHQGIKMMEGRYQGRWCQRMVADCWDIKRGADGHNHSENSRKRKFGPQI